MNPQLLIISGPNGAGKSTFSKDLSPPGALIYDADIVKARIEKSFPDIPIESIYHAVQQDFLDKVDETLKERRHFTIETNFRDSELMTTVERFGDAGYETGLIYLSLRSVAQSMDRVNRRVKNGGHFVDNESIRYNFKEGLKNLTYFLNRFDHVEIIDLSGDLLTIRSLLSIQDRQLTYYEPNPPEWTQPYIFNIVNQYRDNNPNRNNDKDIHRGPRR